MSDNKGPVPKVIKFGADLVYGSSLYNHNERNLNIGSQSCTLIQIKSQLAKLEQMCAC